jgi:hypothetical protein
MIIYKCTNLTTNRSYIGKTVRSLKIRKYEHLKELYGKFKGGIWQSDFDIYGEQDFVFEVIEELTDPVSLSAREKYLIDSLNTLEPYGYNKTKNSGPIYSTDKLSTLSKHSLDTLENIMSLALSLPYKEVEEIAQECEVSVNVVADLLRCKSYAWLADASPFLYKEIVSISASKCARSTYLKSLNLIYALDLYGNTDLLDKEIAAICDITTNILRDLVRQKAYLAIKDLSPTIYDKAISKYAQKNIQRVKEKTVLDISTNTYYTFNTCAEGSRLLGIDHRRISDLLAGRIKIYKTFVLEQDSRVTGSKI